MSNVSLSSQQLLTQALAQLNSLNKASIGERPSPQTMAAQAASGQLASQNPRQIGSETQPSSPQSEIQTLIRRLMAHADSPSDGLIAIENALRDSSIVKSPTSKLLLESILKQLQQGLINGDQSDSHKIKQLLTSSALNISQTQMTAALSATGLLSGLTRLLQITLLTRLAKNQPSMTESVSNLLNSLFEPASNVSKSTLSQSIKDINLLEQKHQILKQLQKIFSQHQSSKLLNAEQSLQGQDTLYYVLPSGTGEAKRDIELLVKRERNDESDQQNTSTNNTTWHLTMKLMIGELGEMLTKVKLSQSDLKIDFYTSNQQLKNRVNDYTPLLIKRLQNFGISLSTIECQLGKIPDTLMTKPYQIFETQA